MSENLDKNEVPMSDEQLKKLRRIEIARKAGQANKGKKSARTLAKLRTAEAIRVRILQSADKLISSQMIMAVGTHRMVVLSFDEEGKKHIETVRDEKRMENLLTTGEYGKDYLILEGSKPDWKAAQALLDRALGKAAQSVEVKHTGTFSLIDLAKKRKELEPIKAIYSLPQQKEPIDVSATETKDA